MTQSEGRLTILKTIALLSQARWWNVGLVALAQFLTALFVLNDPTDWKATLLDLNLHIIGLSTALVVAGGFIINNFYDQEKDMINRPLQTAFEHIVSTPTALNIYLFLNLLAIVLASSISWRAVLFFSVFAASLWAYSHKIKKLAVVANLIKALLSFLPFFAIFFYYKNPHFTLVIYAIYLFTLELTRGLVKDVVGLKGDTVLGYPTVPARTGYIGLARHLSLISVASSLIALILICFFHLDQLWIYLGLSLLLQYFSWNQLPKWVEQSQKARKLHIVYKLFLISGILLLVLL
jgi:4-hydroxybenzoate polyprenyltransferase